MSASFFEKLTGAETEEEPQPLTKKVEKKIKKHLLPSRKKK